MPFRNQDRGKRRKRRRKRWKGTREKSFSPFLSLLRPGRKGRRREGAIAAVDGKLFFSFLFSFLKNGENALRAFSLTAFQSHSFLPWWNKGSEENCAIWVSSPLVPGGGGPSSQERGGGKKEILGLGVWQSTEKGLFETRRGYKKALGQGRSKEGL